MRLYDDEYLVVSYFNCSSDNRSLVLGSTGFMPSPESSRENGKKGGLKKGQKFDITIKRQELKKELLKKYAGRLASVFESHFDSAEGLWYEDEYKKIYKQKPDATSAKLVIEYLLGRPEQPLTGGDPDSNPIKVEISVKKMLDKIYG